MGNVMQLFQLLCQIHEENFDTELEYAREIRDILEEYDCFSDENIPEWFIKMLCAVRKAEPVKSATPSGGMVLHSNAASIPVVFHTLGQCASVDGSKSNCTSHKNSPATFFSLPIPKTFELSQKQIVLPVSRETEGHDAWQLGKSTIEVGPVIR